MSEARPIRLPGSSAMSVVLQRARAALAAWAREWVSGDEAQHLATLNVASAEQADLCARPEFEGVQGAQGRAWFRHGARDRLQFGQAVFGARPMPQATRDDAWMTAVAERAWAARNHAVCEALVGAPRAAPAAQGCAWPASLSSFGSGAVKVVCEPLALYAIADSGVWSGVPPAERAVAHLATRVALERAARRASLRVEVVLGSVELELSRLMDLHRGDVLRLPARLDEPLTVSCAGRPIACAVLGAADGRKAVQITGKHH